MRITTSIIALLSLCNVGVSQEYKLVWSDEFNGKKLDKSVWSYETGTPRNNEAAYFTKRRKNLRIEDSVLVFEAHKQPYMDKQYTSADIYTKDKKTFLYGRIEVSAKVPKGRGTWPAAWTVGAAGEGWPKCGEIDIMEYVGYDSYAIHSNIHTESYNHMIGTNKGEMCMVREPWKDFHIYAVDWYKDSMCFFVDTIKYFTFKNEGTGKNEWPFNHPHFVILNLSIGGSWGGLKGIDDSLFPHRYEVDYIRYYNIIE